MNAPASTRKRFLRFVGFSFALVIMIIVGLAGVWLFARQKAARHRAQWKAPTLQRLTALSITNEEIQREINDLKARPRPSQDWANDQVLLMANGEYIIFSFRHGANNGFVDHLFLGHGSNGKWLYSTYHFCNQMAAVSAE